MMTITTRFDLNPVIDRAHANGCYISVYELEEPRDGYLELRVTKEDYRMSLIISRIEVMDATFDILSYYVNIMIDQLLLLSKRKENTPNE